MDCESIRRRVMGNNTYPKLERTIAVARNIFMNYPLQEAFLSFAYHPDNFYCYVMDSKSNASFVKRMKALGECLPNVFIMEKMFDMDSSGHYQDHGHFLCMKTLIERDSKWQHILLLQNFDMIVRTMKEIVEMSKIFNGTQSIQVVGPIYGRYDNKANWTPKGLKLWKNETGKTKAQLETKLDIGKGNNEAFLSRDFVEAIFKELNVDNILNRFNDLKKYGTDEMLIQTLAINSWMGLSGQIPNHCHKSLKGFTRYTHWIFSKTADGCKGKVRRHNVCLMGVEYLPRMKGYWEIAVNKVHPEYDFGSIMCMGEYLHNIEVGITKRDFNTNSYKESPQVRQMELIRLGKYDAKNFKCS